MTGVVEATLSAGILPFLGASAWTVIPVLQAQGHPATGALMVKGGLSPLSWLHLMAGVQGAVESGGVTVVPVLAVTMGTPRAYGNVSLAPTPVGGARSGQFEKGALAVSGGVALTSWGMLLAEAWVGTSHSGGPSTQLGGAARVWWGVAGAELGVTWTGGEAAHCLRLPGGRREPGRQEGAAVKTLAIPSGATLLASSAVVRLAGCQWVDTRPEVTITPAGDLVGSVFVELQVDAGGAPRAQILVDGRTWGLVPTGEIVDLDLQALAKGDHELIARVELGTSPRSSQPRRLVRVLSEPDLPVGSTAESDPWKPFRVEFRADLPMTEVAVEVTGVDQVAIPFTQEIAADCRSVVVAAAGTLAGLGAVRIDFQARGPDGERGDVTVQYRMPDPIWVGVQVRSVEHVDLLFTPEVPVPGATVVVSDGAGN